MKNLCIDLEKRETYDFQKPFERRVWKVDVPHWTWIEIFHEYNKLQTLEITYFNFRREISHLLESRMTLEQ